MAPKQSSSDTSIENKEKIEISDSIPTSEEILKEHEEGSDNHGENEDGQVKEDNDEHHGQQQHEDEVFQEIVTTPLSVVKEDQLASSESESENSENKSEHQEEGNFSSVAASSNYKRLMMFGILIGSVFAIYLILDGAKSDQNQEKSPSEKILERQSEAKRLVEEAKPISSADKIEIKQAPQISTVPPIETPQPPEPPPPPVPTAPSAPSIQEAPSSPSGVVSTQSLPVVSAPTTSSTPMFNFSQSSARNFFSSKDEEALKKKALDERRKSSIMVMGGGGGTGGGSGAQSGSGKDKAKDGKDSENKASSSAEDKSQFLGFGEGTFGESSIAKTKATQVKATHIGKLDTIIAQGKIAHAILETAINTDLPGVLRAVITRDVYGESGRNILIPKGSRVIGSYQGDIQTGQYRVAIMWNRLIRPDGVDISLDSPGVDALGRSGAGGFLDDKFLTKLTNALLVSYVIPVAASKIFSNNNSANTPSTTTTTNSNGVTTTSTTATVQQQQLQQSQDKFNEVMSKSLQDAFSTKPTLYIDQGTEINIFVNKDIVFPSDSVIGGAQFVK